MDKIGTCVMGYDFERLIAKGMVMNELVSFTPEEDQVLFMSPRFKILNYAYNNDGDNLI